MGTPAGAGKDAMNYNVAVDLDGTERSRYISEAGSGGFLMLWLRGVRK